MDASVIIPTYNEYRDIGECLESLMHQSFKNFEVIVVDDGSTDRTVEIAKKFKVRIIKGKHKGPGFSRNLGAMQSKAKILVFVDADMTFEKDYLKNLLSPILSNKALGTTHELEIVKNVRNIWSRCWGRIRVSKKEAENVKIFRAIRKSDFLRMGGFDPKYGYADDQTFWYKYKIKPIVAKDTICYHKNPETLNAVYKQSSWIGASIDSAVFRIPLLKYAVPYAMALASPVAIIAYSIKRCIQNRDALIFPAMLVFMAFRYFGTISGIHKRIFFEVNTK